MDKKYQVFVSSTYKDLLEERQEVMQALLELDCIPVGMELFPAADDDQWTLIKGLIDDCDYYILIVGGRYGSTSEKGISFTQMEYEYAISQEIPIISFLPKEPNKIELGKTDLDPELHEKLKAFKDLVQKKMCRYWTSASDLGSQVSRSLIKLIKSKPRVGWVKADRLPTEDTVKEILGLRSKVEQLQKELELNQTSSPKGTENLSQGEDHFILMYSYKVDDENVWSKPEIFESELELTWNKIFYKVSPFMIDEANEERIKSAIEQQISEEDFEELSVLHDGKRISNIRLSIESFQTIKIQLRALGLITKSTKKRSIKDTSTYWKVTPYGDNVMVKLRALKKPMEAIEL